MFKPTHVLTVDGCSFDVCMIDGVYYTREEFESETRASYELSNGVLTCNGSLCDSWSVRQIKSRHFESWYKISRGYSHGWTTEIEESVSAEAFESGGWHAVGSIFAEAQRVAKYNLGISPPPNEMHEHITGSGRVRFSVDSDGNATVIISRPIGDVLGVRFDPQGAIVQSWKIGSDPVFARHVNAATEIAHCLGGESAGLLAAAELSQHHAEPGSIVSAQGCRVVYDPNELITYPHIRAGLHWVDAEGHEATEERLLLIAKRLDRAVSRHAVTDVYAVGQDQVIGYGRKLPTGSMDFSYEDFDAMTAKLTEIGRAKCVAYELPEGTKEIRRLGFVLQFKPEGCAEFFNLRQVTAKDFWYSRRAQRVECQMLHKGDYRIQAITWTPSNGQRVADLPVIETYNAYDSLDVSVGDVEYRG